MLNMPKLKIIGNASSANQYNSDYQIRSRSFSHLRKIIVSVFNSLMNEYCNFTKVSKYRLLFQWKALYLPF